MDRGLKKLLITIGVLLVGTTIFTLISNYRANKKYDSRIEKIEKALRDWAEEYQRFLPDNNETITIPLRTLKQTGYIENNFRNPKTKTEFSNQLLMTITKTKKNYVYKVLDEDPNMVEDYDVANVLAPIIVLKGDRTEYAEIGYLYEEKGYEAITLEGKEADEVKISITSNNKNVASINTSKPATYEITYRFSYAKQDSEITRTVIVKDTEKPEVKMERLIVTSAEAMNLDLLKEVEIKDNSNGKLKIKTYGSLSSIPGKYTITYQVTDPSGNIMEKKRVIRVEE